MTPTKYTAPDTFTQKIMIERGTDPQHIVVTGHRGFDQFHQAATVQNGEYRRTLRIEVDERVIVYFGQAPDSHDRPDTEETLKWVVESLQSNYWLIYAGHPRNPSNYSEVLRKVGAKLIETDLSSDQLLEVPNIALTPHSTMGLKAALLDIHTINLIIEGDLQQMRQLLGGLTISLWGGNHQVRSQEELGVALAETPTANPTALKRRLSIDGRAAEQVARLVTDSV